MGKRSADELDHAEQGSPSKLLRLRGGAGIVRNIPSNDDGLSPSDSTRRFPNLLLDLTSPSEGNGPYGMVMGINGCYGNTILQLFMNLPQVGHFLIKYHGAQHEAQNPFCVACGLRNIYNSCWAIVVTEDQIQDDINFFAKICENRDWKDSLTGQGLDQQQDAYLFVTWIINEISVDFFPLSKDLKQAWETLLRTKIVEYLRCPHCGHRNKRTIAGDFSLGLHHELSFQEMLDRGIVSENDSCKCFNTECALPLPACKWEVEIEEPAEVIFVCPSLWQFTSGRPKKSKIILPWDEHTVVDLTKYLPRALASQNLQLRYKLVGIAMRSGGYTGGHFVALTRSRDNKWNICDDDAIRPTTIGSFKRKPQYSRFDGHIFVFVRQTTDLINEDTGVAIKEETDSDQSSTSSEDEILNGQSSMSSEDEVLNEILANYEGLHRCHERTRSLLLTLNKLKMGKARLSAYSGTLESDRKELVSEIARLRADIGPEQAQEVLGDLQKDVDHLTQQLRDFEPQVLGQTQGKNPYEAQLRETNDRYFKKESELRKYKAKLATALKHREIDKDQRRRAIKLLMEYKSTIDNLEAERKAAVRPPQAHAETTQLEKELADARTQLQKEYQKNLLLDNKCRQLQRDAKLKAANVPGVDKSTSPRSPPPATKESTTKKPAKNKTPSTKGPPKTRRPQTPPPPPAQAPPGAKTTRTGRETKPPKKYY